MKCLKIPHWTRDFENSKSRQIRRVGYVCVPNRHDGEAYLRMMQEKDADRLFACWIWIVQIASKCLIRGLLLRDNEEPHDAASLAIKTRGQKEWFERAIPFFQKLGWLELGSPDELTDEAEAGKSRQRPHGDRRGATERPRSGYKKEEGGYFPPYGGKGSGKEVVLRDDPPFPRKGKAGTRKDTSQSNANRPPSHRRKPDDESKPLPLADAVAANPELAAKLKVAVAQMRDHVHAVPRSSHP